MIIAASIVHPFFSMHSAAFLAIASVAAVSLLSLVGVSLFLLRESVIRKALLYIVSFSTGSLFGDVFYHILPELAEDHEAFVRAMPLVLLGILISFVIEKIIHWHHCHILPTEHVHCEHHHVGIMSLIGDAAHNFIDGLLIAASFLVSTEIGFATTIAVMLHEIPQEIGDFAILLHSGFSKTKAVLFNLLSASTALLGAIIVLVSAGSAPAISSVLLPIAAGNFLYLAGSDLIPELHKHTGLRQGFLQLLCMILGMGAMFALTFLE